MVLTVDTRRHRSLIRLVGILAIISIPIVALADSHRAGPEDLEDREWRIPNYFIDKHQTWPFRGVGQKGDAYVGFKGGVLKGSPGCGLFTGKYQRRGSQLAISAEWADEKEVPCTADERKNAEQILSSLTNI